MAVDVNPASRLLFGELVIVDDIEFWDTVVLPNNTLPRLDDIQHVVTGNDRIDLLAQRFYQDPVLWWVLAWANDLEILPTDLKVGSVITVPSKLFVETTLTRRRS